jgi:hypothetical protein
VPDRGGVQLERGARVVVRVGPVAGVEPADHHDRVADAEGGADVLGQLAPAGDPDPQAVAVDPAPVLLVEAARRGGDPEVGDERPGVVGAPPFGRGEHIADDHDGGVEHLLFSSALP